MALSRRDMQVYAVMAVTITSAPLIKVEIAKQNTSSSLVVNVLQEGYPVPGSKVILVSEVGNKKSEWVTDARGYAVASKKPGDNDHTIELSSGAYQITVKKDGFLPKTERIFLAEKDFTEKIVHLEPSNHLPIADPGGEAYTNPNRRILLSGAKSKDPDAEKDDPTKGIESYSWVMTSRPQNSNLQLPEIRKKEFYFRPDQIGEYRFNLTVFDGQLEATKEKLVLVRKPYFNGRPLPYPVGGHGTTKIKDKVYLFGGWNETFSNRAYAYDLALDRWDELPPMKVARNHFTTAQVNGLIYIIGGHNEKEPDGIATVEIYNPLTGRWKEGKPLPTPRFNLASVVFEGKIYCFGGAGGFRALEVFDTETQEWTKLAPMPSPRFRHAAQLVGEKAYLIGGKGTENDLEAFNLVNQTWEKLPPMPTGRYYLSSVLMNGLIYVIGGHGKGEDAGEPAVEFYDPEKQVWDHKEPLPLALDIHTTEVYNNSIYIFGGESKFGTFKPVDSTLVYDPRFDLPPEEKENQAPPKPAEAHPPANPAKAEG